MEVRRAYTVNTYWATVVGAISRCHIYLVRFDLHVRDRPTHLARWLIALTLLNIIAYPIVWYLRCLPRVWQRDTRAT